MRKLLNEEAREGPGSVGGENWGTRLSKTTLRSGGGFFNRNSFGAALARNLHALGADDLTIQRILRHSNVSVTQACYIKTANQDSVRALESLDAVLCPSCALESVKPQTLQLQ